MIRLGILGSTRGTSMLAIIEAIQSHQLPATIGVVMSNKPNALILSRAKMHHIPAVFVDPKELTRDEYDRKVTAVLQDYQVDLVVMIGYMRIVSPGFILQWDKKMINIHPSLLPAFAGKMDLDVHRDVLAAGVKETGCTVHYVTEEVDAGPVIIQKTCKVLDDDTPESLKARVQALESNALIEAIVHIQQQAH